jgi:hypothetical protein
MNKIKCQLLHTGCILFDNDHPEGTMMEGLCVMCSCMCVFTIIGIYFNTFDCLVHCK